MRAQSSRLERAPGDAAGGHSASRGGAPSTGPVDSVRPGADTWGVDTADHLSVRVPAKRESLGVVRRALVESLVEADWRGEPVNRVMVACSEAMANAVEHGSQPGALVEVEYTVDADTCVLSVRDDGCPGAGVPSGEPPSPPPETALRGRGLVILHALADKVEILPRPNGTEVRLRFERRCA